MLPQLLLSDERHFLAYEVNHYGLQHLEARSKLYHHIQFLDLFKLFSGCVVEV